MNCTGRARLAAAVRRIDKRRMRREVEGAFTRLGLRMPPVTSKAGALSGGQRQAVAVARAVLWGSRVVIMDKPTAALGVQQTEAVLALIGTLKAEGVATLLVSHNMEHVLRVADRVAVFRLGRKIADLDQREQPVTGMHLVGLITSAHVGRLMTGPPGGGRAGRRGRAPVVLITGGATGIRRACAAACGAAGATVVLLSLPGPDLSLATSELREAGVAAHAVVADVRDFESVHQAASQMPATWAASTCSSPAPGSLTSRASPRLTAALAAGVATNLLGTANCIRAVAPLMTQAGTGDIVVIASVSGRDTYVGEPLYIASNGAWSGSVMRPQECRPATSGSP